MMRVRIVGTILSKAVAVAVLTTVIAACQPAAGPEDVPALCSGVTQVDSLRPPYHLLVDATADQLPLRLPGSLRDDLTAKAAAGYAFSIGTIQGSARADLLWRARDLGREDLAKREDNRREDAAELAGCVAEQAERVEARVEGSDVLGAMQAAGDELQAARRPGSAPPMLAVVSNGLANTGPLDLREAFSAEGAPEEIVRMLSASRDLPDLHGVQVRFYHLGQTTSAPFQQRRNRLWLMAVWSELCRQARAAACQVVADVGNPDPDVRTRMAPRDFAFAAPKLPAPDCGRTDGRCSLPSILLFEPGSAELLAGADTLLRPIAIRLRRTGKPATVEGHTASWGSPAYRVELSRRRAAAVVRRLVKLGVHPRRLTSRGLGSRDPVADDLDADGRLVEPQASRNRRVEILFAP